MLGACLHGATPQENMDGLQAAAWSRADILECQELRSVRTPNRVRTRTLESLDDEGRNGGDPEDIPGGPWALFEFETVLGFHFILLGVPCPASHSVPYQRVTYSHLDFARLHTNQNLTTH